MDVVAMILIELCFVLIVYGRRWLSSDGDDDDGRVILDMFSCCMLIQFSDRWEEDDDDKDGEEDPPAQDDDGGVGRCRARAADPHLHGAADGQPHGVRDDGDGRKVTR